MINRQWNPQSSYIFDFARQTLPNNFRTPNQTFRIQRELYTLLDRRGNGKFGSVWAAVTPNGHRAAVKVFNLHGGGKNMNQSQLLNSFENEVRMAYILRNATNCVVTMYGVDLDLQRGVALMAMELGDDSLSDRVKHLHQMHSKSLAVGYDYISAENRKNIWIHLVNIILALHQYNVIHRDIKPANLVFFGSVLKVVDLGIAQDELVKQSGDLIRINSPYSAPECLTGEAPVTSKADIWSIGAILYYLTYGRAPDQWSPQAPYGVPSTRSIPVQDVLHHCLQRNLYQRANHHWLVQHPLTNSTVMI